MSVLGAQGWAQEPGPAEATAPAAVFSVMGVDDVSLDLPSQFPLVTLVELEPPRRELVFPVGLTEGTAMAQALRRLTGARPMTHEVRATVRGGPTST